MINLLKLTNGEMIIGEVLVQTDTHLSIKDPLEVRITYMTGVPSIIANFWIPISDKGTVQDIRQQHIIAIADVNDEIESYYVRSLEKITDPYKPWEEVEEEKFIDDNFIANTSGGIIH